MGHGAVILSRVAIMVFLALPLAGSQIVLGADETKPAAEGKSEGDAKPAAEAKSDGDAKPAAETKPATIDRTGSDFSATPDRSPSFGFMPDTGGTDPKNQRVDPPTVKELVKAWTTGLGVVQSSGWPGSPADDCNKNPGAPHSAVLAGNVVPPTTGQVPAPPPPSGGDDGPYVPPSGPNYNSRGEDPPKWRSGPNARTPRDHLVSLQGKRFTDEMREWIKSHLPELNPRQLAEVCPAYGSLSQDQKGDFLVALLESITQVESGFNVNNSFYEKTMGKTSDGLLQLSFDDRDNYPKCKDYFQRPKDVYDPMKNVQCGVAIIEQLSQGSGSHALVAASGQGNGVLGKYWSTVRPSHNAHQEFRDQLYTRTLKDGQNYCGLKGAKR